MAILDALGRSWRDVRSSFDRFGAERDLGGEGPFRLVGFSCFDEPIAFLDADGIVAAIWMYGEPSRAAADVDDWTPIPIEDLLPTQLRGRSTKADVLASLGPPLAERSADPGDARAARQAFAANPVPETYGPLFARLGTWLKYLIDGAVVVVHCEDEAPWRVARYEFALPRVDRDDLDVVTR